MFKVILNLYQGSGGVKKLAFKEKLISIKMSKREPIITYLSKFTQVPNELGGVGETVGEKDLVSLALLGLHKSRFGFQDAVSGKENLPNWERFWSDCVQEEIWRGTRDGRLVKTEDEENFALAGKGKAETSQNGRKKKKDLSKIKCFHCHEFRHYATKCPNRKKGSGEDHVVASTKVDRFASQFEKNFSLIACMARVVGSNTWYIDSGASFHMTKNREYFNQLEEKEILVHIELGDNGKYTTMGVGIVSFKREFGSSLHLKDVLYVPSLKNLVSVATLEDKGYNVIFNRGKAYLQHLASKCKKQIGVRMKNLYKLQVKTCSLEQQGSRWVEQRCLAQAHGTLAS
eukprot:PITA_30288